MSTELETVRAALTEELHRLADDQDEYARAAVDEGDSQKETAHRGAAVGLRMAAGAVSMELGRSQARTQPRYAGGLTPDLFAPPIVARQAARR